MSVVATGRNTRVGRSWLPSISRKADVERLLDIELAIEVCEEAFRRMAAGEAENIPRPERRPEAHSALHERGGGLPGTGGWKCYTTTRTAARFHVGLVRRERRRWCVLVEADRLGQLRTGATTGVAVGVMADPNATEMGLFGAGWQAQSQLAAVAVRGRFGWPMSIVATSKSGSAFCEAMSERLGIEVRPADRPQEAAEDLPIVVTATTSREPVFDGNWLAEGALVCAAGSNWLNKAEIDSTVVRRADNIVCDSVPACQNEAGDFVDALEKGIFDWSRAVNLGDVLAGKATGRNTRESITLFKSVGLAIEDVALGGKLLELARQQNVGRELPF